MYIYYIYNNLIEMVIDQYKSFEKIYIEPLEIQGKMFLLQQFRNNVDSKFNENKEHLEFLCSHTLSFIYALQDIPYIMSFLFGNDLVQPTI